MIIAQITDFHIAGPGRFAYGRVDTRTTLEMCVAELLAAVPRPDVVVATGDLVDRGRPEEYTELREALAPLPAPVFVIPGNHDERGALRAAFASDGYLPADRPTLDYAVEDFPVRIVALDTSVPRAGHGELSDAQIGWLEARLAEEPSRPTVVIMHHPPFETGILHMDKIGLLKGAEALGAVISKHAQVERILCGHLHRSIQMRWRGTIASTAPSTAHQVTLDLSNPGDASFTLEPPGYQLHLWRDGMGMVSHTAVVGTHAGPYPFSMVK